MNDQYFLLRYLHGIKTMYYCILISFQNLDEKLKILLFINTFSVMTSTSRLHLKNPLNTAGIYSSQYKNADLLIYSVPSGSISNLEQIKYNPQKLKFKYKL